MISWKILILLLSSTSVFSWIDSAKLYPFLVTIFDSNDIICGGIVVSNKYILSAASCFDQNSGDLLVLFGDPNRGRRIAVREVINPPNYKVKCNQNDIALLELDDKLPLADPEMGVKRILLTEEVDLVDCFNIYMDKNFGQIPGPAVWSKEGAEFPDLKFNDFSLEIGHYLNNVTRDFPLKGSPLICKGKAAGLYSVPWTNPKSGRVLELFTQIPLHFHWIDQNVDNVGVDDPSETVKPSRPDGIETTTSVAPVTTDKPNGDQRLQSHLLMLVFIGLARFLSSMK